MGPFLLLISFIIPYLCGLLGISIVLFAIMTRDKLFLVIGALMGSIVGTGIYLFIWANFYKPVGFTDYGLELLPFFILKILFVSQNIGGTFTLLLSPEDSSDKAVFAHYLFGALMGIPLGIYGFDHFF